MRIYQLLFCSLPLCVALVAAVGCGGQTKTNTSTTTNGASANTTNSDDAASNVAGSETPIDEADQMDATAHDGQVLRHAVFFSFKDSASEADVQSVADAFAALPSKIPEIIDFQWGVNNSPEGLDDGFTHCFLLTFADEKGREVYLPHPDHKAFGDVLRPHMSDVFVIDYWGKKADSGIKKELKHAVFFRFKKDASKSDVEKIEQAFAALPSKIDAIKDFEWGKNNSPEKHDDGFTHCFMVTFDSEEGRAEYLPHADHQAFVEILKPVLDAPRVLDFWETN